MLHVNSYDDPFWFSSLTLFPYQACDPCRAKKQKCDGQKRCHQCVTNNLECKYREIEPKT